ncbi:hypothetical protein [Haloarchaeobius sp. HME9146]|uniref:hypothetical protein n=1 Tax=unclassified Haloarchaeobius TaxID=2614452 RepID=UPI0021BEA317|nr:hypothetical protein [Haloarchaeobius sp. HME9146]MCT9095410.1 hypothetical protein [Haloarchaeobius sp. HME9146]
MCSGSYYSMALLGIFFAPPMVLWPVKLARWDEMLDAIGRRSSGPVEPATWKVALTRYAGVVWTLVGVGSLVACELL